MTKTTTAQIDSLREAANHLRDTIRQLDANTPTWGDTIPTEFSDALAELDRIGFAKTTMALAVADWLEHEAHSLERFGVASSEALAVADLVGGER